VRSCIAQSTQAATSSLAVGLILFPEVALCFRVMARSIWSLGFSWSAKHTQQPRTSVRSGSPRMAAPETVPSDFLMRPAKYHHERPTERVVRLLPRHQEGEVNVLDGPFRFKRPVSTALALPASPSAMPGAVYWPLHTFKKIDRSCRPLAAERWPEQCSRAQPKTLLERLQGAK
jgi:hypothetical protein